MSACLQTKYKTLVLDVADDKKKLKLSFDEFCTLTVIKLMVKAFVCNNELYQCSPSWKTLDDALHGFELAFSQHAIYDNYLEVEDPNLEHPFCLLWYSLQGSYHR